MPDFSLVQLAFIIIIFVWSGFVRSGLGFGGAIFTLPFLLLVHNDPLFFLPIISIHLLLFASITLGREQWKKYQSRSSANPTKSTINWWFVRYSLPIMLAPKIIGVVGLLILPIDLMNIIIFILIAGYGITYITDREMRSQNSLMNIVFLALGAYISGTSLLGGPLIIAVALRYISPQEYRSTLFVIWVFLVSIKMIAFAVAGVDLQFINALLLLPFAGIGHYLGLIFHDRLLSRDDRGFYRAIGWILLVTSCAGIGQNL